MPTSRSAFQVQTPASLGVAIRHFRRQAELSQAELSNRVGLHRSYLSALESGHETAYLNRIFRLLKQLGVEMRLEQVD